MRGRDGVPVVQVGPVPFFVEGADNVCPFWWHGDSSGDDAPQSLGQGAEEVGGEVVVRLSGEAVVAGGFVLSELSDGFLDFVHGYWVLLHLLACGVVKDLGIWV